MNKIEKCADISVIIPTYNSEKTIERAVNSVFNQTIMPLEIIIVDDCSTHIKNKELLLKLKEKLKNIKIIFLNKNSGPATARNTAWDIASGKYIAFLDSDDVWHPQKLEIQYKYMENHNDIFFLWHHKKIIKNNNLNEFYKQRIEHDYNVVKLNPYKLLFKHYTSGGTPSVMLRNCIKYRFEKNKKYSEDYLLWLEILFNYKGMLLNTILSASFKADYGEGGLSNDLWKHEKGELETFKILYKRGIISYLFYVCASMFSLLKFIRRILISKYIYIKNNCSGE